MLPIEAGVNAKDLLLSPNEIHQISQEMNERTTLKSKVEPFLARSTSDDTAIIKTIQIDNLASKVGDLVPVKMDLELRGLGANGNTTFDASMEELQEGKMYIRIDSYQHSVPSTKKVNNAKAMNDFRSKTKKALGNWHTRRFDASFFHAMSFDCTNIVASGHHNVNDTTLIEKDNVLTLADGSEARRRALEGVDGKGNAVPPFLPTSTTSTENSGYYEETEMFIMLVGNASAEHLKKDPNWKSAMDNLERGKDNPIFTGALGYYDGVLYLPVKTETDIQSGILTSERTYLGFSNVKKCDLTQYRGKDNQATEINLFLGAGCCYMVDDDGVQYFEDTPKDPRYPLTGADRTLGVAKARFNSTMNAGLFKNEYIDDKDFGVIAVVSSTGK
jgi:N4-gp56 family major capsid protein